MPARRRTGGAAAGGRSGSGTGAAAGGNSADTSVEEIPRDPEQDLGDPQAVARAICLRLLTQRARSRAELADALTRRGVPDDAATVVLDRFVEVGLIDDRALAIGMAGAQHRERGLARRAVAVKLRRRGLDDDIVRDALAGIDPDSERATAHELARKRQRALATLPLDVQRRRLVGMLARKGYPAGVAYEVVRSVTPETQQSSDELLDGLADPD